jgi:hypothetical protein
MKIIGCEFHPRWQQVAVFDAGTGEVEEYKLTNGDGQAERFYRELAVPALSGMPTATDSGFRTIFLIEGTHGGGELPVQGKLPDCYIGDCTKARPLSEQAGPLS